MIKKNLPFYFEAEQAILGTIFLDAKQIIVINDLLSVEDFFDYKHQQIFQVMTDLFKSGQDIDYISVSAFLQDRTLLAKTGGIEYLIDLGNSIPDLNNLDTYIDLIKEAALKRELIKIASEIHDKGFSQDHNIQAYFDFAESKIFALAQKRKVSDFVEIKNLLTSIQNKTITAQNRDTKVVGLSTGFISLDDITLGFKPEEFIVLASRPAMGKSTFMMNLALNISKQNISPLNHYPGIAIFSLEMSNEQIGTRMLSFQTKIYHKKIQLSKGLSQRDLKMMELACDELGNFNIFFDDSATVNILDIRTKCRQLKNKNKLDFVIIDYLQLIQKAQPFNRQEEVSAISRSLKQMARELKIPVLALSQLSRDVEKREDKRPILSDLRDSGSIEQDADIVMFLYRDDYYNKDRTQFGKLSNVAVELIVSKNRQGVIGMKKFNLDLLTLCFNESYEI